MHVLSIFTGNKSKPPQQNESEGDAGVPSTPSRIFSRMTPPRPSSSSGGDDSSSSRPGTPTTKSRRLIKSASSNMLRKASPGSPRLQSSSTMLPERPRTRDSSPASRVRMMDSGRRAASATVSGSLAPPLPPLPTSNPSDNVNNADMERGRALINRMSTMSFKSKSRPASLDRFPMPPMPVNSTATAKVLGTDAEYDLGPLLRGEKVTELWGDDPNGSIFVYLFGEGKPASFKVSAKTITASPTLNALAYNSVPQTTLSTLPEDSTISDAVENSPHASSDNLNGGPFSVKSQSVNGLINNPLNNSFRHEGHLHFPSLQSDNGTLSEADRLIDARNLFAFLTGLPLIATQRTSTVFEVLISITGMLSSLGFYDEMGGGDFGAVADKAFTQYTNEFELRDVRGSHEKLLKALILAEKMRYEPLYREAYTHLAGSFSRLGKDTAKLYEAISSHTRHRVEKEAHILHQWQNTANLYLFDFDFPHLFNNSAQSNMTAESRVVRFAAWQKNFANFRTFVLAYYKNWYGSWPPKANKKNGLTISGLNRLVLKQLYEDFCALYDLHVDRESLTTRKLDVEEEIEDDENLTENDLQVLALRKIMSEHDRSALPLSPPMPFDLPRLPAITTVDAAFDARSKAEQVQAESCKLEDYKITLILAKAHNMDMGTANKPFLEAYTRFEEKMARGRSLKDLRDMRLGYWLFLYAVLQRLPLLVVDAEDLNFTEGVEYFLCKPPYGPPPWKAESFGNKINPNEHGQNTTDVIYQRSHCWEVSHKFIHDLKAAEPPLSSPEFSADTLQGSPYLAAVREDDGPGEAPYLNPLADSPAYSNWQDTYETSMPPPPVQQYSMPPPPVQQYPVQQQYPGQQQYPVRSDSMMTHSTMASTARHTSGDYSQHYRTPSQQYKHLSRGSEVYTAEPVMNDGTYGNYPPLANPYPIGIGSMGPPTRPPSGYYGVGANPVRPGSRPVSRPTSRPASRAAFLEDEFLKGLEGPPSLTTNNSSGSGGYRTSFNNASTPQLSSESNSVSDPTQSVLGGSVSGSHIRSASQQRPMTATKMGPSSFDDILENMGPGKEKKEKKKKGLLGVGGDKKRGRLSFFSSGTGSGTGTGSSTG